MIRRALLYLPADDDHTAARLIVAGRPVAARAILTAVRAGIGAVLVPARLRSPALDATLVATPRAHAAVTWVTDAAGLAPGPVLLLPATLVVPATALAALLREGAGAALADSLASGAPLLADDGRLAAGLAGELAAGAPVGAAVVGALAEDPPRTTAPGWCVRVIGPDSAAEAEARLYAGLGSPIDTRLDVLFHRRLSRHVSRWAVARAVGPNQVTLASGLVGLAAAGCLARGEPVAAAGGLLLYAAAVVLDHADGEVARLTLAESAVGEWLDIVVDTVVHVALVLALGVASLRAAGAGLGLGAVAAAGVVASAALSKLVPPSFDAGGAGRLVERLSSRDGFYAMLLLFLGALAVAPAALPGFMVLIALGGNAYWLSRLVYLAGRRAGVSR